MKNLWLLPAWCRKAGWALFIPCAILGLYIIFIEGYVPLEIKLCEVLKTNVAIIGTLIGLYMIAFSKEKIEDEFINSLRMDAMIKAIILNCVIIVLASLIIYGGWYVYTLSITQYFVLLAYIIIFRYNIHKYSCKNEE
ncbi:MAG: hypothetical protein IIV19_01930 [Bacteroidaceae bacterium]|jgi:hypothetical protein|nr:hypothetical protein [Bacteroidaceae bacterium]